MSTPPPSRLADHATPCPPSSPAEDQPQHTPIQRIVLVPGHGGSGPDHWQTWLEHSYRGTSRVNQQGWFRPNPQWAHAIEAHLTELNSRQVGGCGSPLADGSTIIIAHSCGAIAAAQWAADGGIARHPEVAAMVFVCPANTEAPDAMAEITELPLSMAEVPVRSMVVASDNDPHCSLEAARELARAWGSELRCVGSAGHVNVDSGYGPWPEGVELIESFVGQPLPRLRVEANGGDGEAVAEATEQGRGAGRRTEAAVSGGDSEAGVEANGGYSEAAAAVNEQGHGTEVAAAELRPETPFLMVQPQIVAANVEAMAQRARAVGVAVRPHAKTHKCAQIAAMQIRAGAVGLTVATVAEAEAFAAAGFHDLFIAYPLWVDAAKAVRLRALAGACRIAVGVDSTEAVDNLVIAGLAGVSKPAEEVAQSAGRANRGAQSRDGDGGDGGDGDGAPGLAEETASAEPPACVEAMIEIDSGMHRSGVAPEVAGELAAYALKRGVLVRGVFTFPGHSYGPDAREAAARNEAEALAGAAAGVREAFRQHAAAGNAGSRAGQESANSAGGDSKPSEPELVISGGSSPSALPALESVRVSRRGSEAADAEVAGPDALKTAGTGAAAATSHATPSSDAGYVDNTGNTQINELRPGAYVFNDAQQWELGVCAPENIALTCHATVVSRAGGRLVLDAGSKALGADRAAWASGYGRLLDYPEARIVMLSEHHAVVEHGPDLPLGSRVRVVPNHCCNAVNLADTLYVSGADAFTAVAQWPVLARGGNS